MKKLFFSLMTLLLAFGGVARADEVTIGEGTATCNTNPIGTYYNYSITEQLYTAEEIGVGGTINSVSFYYMGLAAKDLPITMYMANVDAADLSTGISLADATEVFSGTLSVPATEGWVTITLATPFAYDGTSNLLIGFIKDYLYYFSGQSWQGTSTASTMARYTQSDYNAYTTSTVPSSAQANRPNIKLDIVPAAPITCPKPTGLTATLTQGNGSQVTLGWTENGNATQWQICIDDDETQLILTQTNPATITGFVPEMTYTAKVRAYCDANDQSAWSNTVTFQPSDKIRIGSGTATNQYLPTYTYYNYSLTQQIYTAEEIGTGAGAILSVDFYATGERTRTLDIYMVNTTKSSFESTTDWITVTSNDLVYSGEVTFGANAWTPIELDSPFAYDGTSNLAIIVDDNSGSYVTSAAFYAFNAQNQAIRVYSDGTNYDPKTPSSYTGTVLSQKNQIRLDMVTGPIVFHTITVNCNPEGAGVLTGGGNALEGRIRTLTATPNYGYEFINWTKDGQVVSTEPTYSFTVTEDATFTANFYEIPRHIVRVLADPLDGGYVTGGATYLENDTCTITETPAAGFSFLGWKVNNQTISTDSIYTFLVTGDKTITAQFEIDSISLSLSSDTLDLGIRPTGAWMRPFTATLTNNGASAHVTSFESENPYYGIDLGDLSVPFTIENGEDVEFSVTWGHVPSTSGAINTNLTVDYENGEFTGTKSWVLMGTAYTPVTGDVWEQPFEVNSFPYTETVTAAPFYNNYILPYPSLEDGKDVVYKLVFDEDTQLSASVTEGENGKMVLYEESFKGLGGPDMTNRYTGPTLSNRGDRVETELTIHDGAATNSYVPVHGLWADAYLKCEMVYPATELSEMAGTTISTIKYYASSPAAGAWTGTFQVFLKEVSAATISEFSGTEGATIVYEGTLDATGSEMEIAFTTPYTYTGGNLLVGVYQTVKGIYKSVTWAGESVTGASVQGYNSSSLDGVSPTQRDFLPKTTFVYDNGATGIGITDMTVAAGTYYLVASSTSNTFSVSIETSALSCPEVVSNPTPADSALNVSDINTLLKWKLGDRTTEYCLRFGTSATNLETLVDWTRELKEQYKFTDTLNYHTTYFWQVCERNDACPNGVEGPVWCFTTALPAPTQLTANPGTEILQGETLHLSWIAPAEHRDALSYNVYKRTGTYSYTYDSIGHTNDTLFDITGLENTSTSSSYTSYTYCVKAVYPQGMSAYSSICTVNVYSTGMVNGHVYEQDGTTPIAGATVTFAGTARNYVFTTANNGTYSAQLPAKTFSDYYVYATADGYLETHRGSSVTVSADTPLTDIDFVMLENYYPPVDVTVAHYPDTADFESAQVQVTWNEPTGDVRDESIDVMPHAQGERGASTNEGGNRSLQYYRVYRTAWENNSYNESNTVRIADNVTNLSVIDETFDTLSTGIYKYGVSCVYEGNQSDSYFEGFENGMPTGWTTIDADGDGYNWVLGSACDSIYLDGNLAGFGHNNSYDLMTSGSFTNVGDIALNPDNYLITPQMTFGNTFTFWAQAQDANYNAEHFGVAVSTTNNTNASAFTTIQEWTFGSRNANPRPTQIRGGNREATAWVQYSVDLGQYAGQTGYLAIRHFGCTDQFLLNIDDVLVWGEPPAPPYFLPTESTITWSNPIDKGYYIYDGVTVSVSLNNGESPEGTMVGMMQPESQYEVNPLNETLMVTLDASGNYTWDVFRKGTYLVYAYKDGYIESDTVMVINSDTLISLVLNEDLATASDLYVSRTGWATWNVPTSDSTSFGRGLLESKITLTELDGDTIFTALTTDNYMQLPVEDLTELDIYRFNVNLVYSGGTSDPVSVPWAYEPCDNFEGLTNLEGIVDPNGVTLTWEYPELADPTRTQGTELWNEVTSFDAAEGAQYGVASDGEYIYTCNWGWSSATYNFFKYDMEGNVIEGFNVPGCGYIRDLTYDGRYFYGGASSNVLYCIDLANKRLVRTINTAVTIRHCSYDPEYDGFWVGNWGDLYLINRSGTIQFTGVAPSSCSGSGYYVDDNGNSHLYLLCQPEQNALVYDYDIATNTINPTPVFDLEAGLNEYGGTSGGAFIGEYNGYTAFFGDLQVTPNRIGIYGLRANEINPIQPTSILGTLVFRDGEMLGFSSDTTFVDTLGTIDNQYDLRLVYDGERKCPLNNVSYIMSCPQAVELVLQQFTITATCDPAEAGTVMGAGTYMMGDTCTLIATANPGYEFVLWMLDGEMVGEYYEPEYSFVVTEDGDYVAVFEQIDYYIYTIAVPEAGGILEGEGSYYYGDTCTLIATANEGYDFVNWTRMIYGGDEPEEVVVSTDPTYVFVIDDETAAGGDETEYYAHFALKTFEITVLANPEDGGVVTGAGTYAYGDTVVLTAVSAEGYTFVNWLKDGGQVSIDSIYTFTMDENGGGTYEAQFSQNDYVVTAIANPEEGGMVTGTGPYNYGDTCTLVATPNPSYGFINWTLEGVEVSTETTYSFIVTGNASYVANFELLTITQSSHFDNGWTWWSSYIEEDGDTCLMQLEQGLGASGLIIKTQTNSLTHVGNGWYGPITALDNAQTYRVKTNAEADVDITGLPVVTASHPVTLNPNWTWIGYPCTTEMSVTEALAGITPSAGDVLKSQTTSTVYLGTMWAGALNTLTPGMGLMYKSSRSDAITLTFPTGAKGGDLKPNLTAENNHWQPNTSAYPDNMTVLAVVELDGVELQGENYELAAFANGECRGSVQLLYIEPLNRYMAVLTVSGDEAAELHFGLYDNLTGEEILGAEENLTYQTNAVVGGVDELFTIHFRGFTGLDEFKLVDIFPNPVRRGELFNIGIAAEEVGVVRVETVNALGAVISSETSTGMPANFKAPNVPGIYTLRISVEGKETCYRKLVVE